MLGEILALLSAVASGFSVVLVRKYSAGSNAFNMSVVITIVGMAVLWPLAIAENSWALLNLAGFLLFALSGILSPGIVRLFYYKGLRALGASGNSAVFSVYPLYSALLAVVLLSEVLSPANWTGLVLIIAGVVFIEVSIHTGSLETGAGRKSLIFPILGGLTLGVAAIIRKYALEVSDAPVLGVAIAYVFSLLPYILILAYSASTRRQLAFKQDLKWFWTAGIGQAVSWMLAFWALSVEQVSITTPLLSIEPIFVVAFGYFYLKEVEYVSPRLVASILITVVGVILVTL